jgi:hypothetical protein
MEIKFANNASTVLANAIEEATTTLIVATDAGQLFPVLSLPTDYFKITVVNPGDGTWEIMKVTKVAGDEFTVVRAQEGTKALSFPQNAVVENRLTAESIQAILNDVSASPTEAGRIRVATESEVEDGVITDACLTPANCDFLKVFPGVITAFSGVFDSGGFPIDSNTGKARKDWHKCDGTNNTPNLQDRFIVCAGSKYPVATTGGSTSYTFTMEVLEHRLTIDEMPEHTHKHKTANNEDGWGALTSGWDAGVIDEVMSAGGNKPHKHDHKFTYPDVIEPPYYALAYIMKIK